MNEDLITNKYQNGNGFRSGYGEGFGYGFGYGDGSGPGSGPELENGPEVNKDE